ncbi:amidohydrolase family protein [Mycolicibacterium sp. XJ1819]
MPIDLNERLDEQHNAGRVVRRERTLVPDPEPRNVYLPLISVDDHFMEPRDTFVDRMPAKFADQTPRVVEDSDGMEWWQFEDERVMNSGANAMSSWPAAERTGGPVRFDEVRLGTYDVHGRVKDMDVNGVAASLCFPSMVFGFCGQRFTKFSDPELGMAAMRAYNDWIIEAWVGAYPDRFIAQQVTWLPDPKIAADEIRRNAERGFKAVSFSENPEALGFDSLYSGKWDPFFEACAETSTVVNLHVGSSSQTMVPSKDSPPPVIAALFEINAFAAATDWLFAGIPSRFPELKIVMSESGIAWVPMLIDRLSFLESRFNKDNDGGMNSTWSDTLTPNEVLARNFWYTSFFDPTAYRLLDVIGESRVMMEVDYPHSDSTWPDTQEVIKYQIDALDRDVQARLTSGNAAEVYRHPLVALPGQ